MCYLSISLTTIAPNLSSPSLVHLHLSLKKSIIAHFDNASRCLWNQLADSFRQLRVNQAPSHSSHFTQVSHFHYHYFRLFTENSSVLKIPPNPIICCWYLIDRTVFVFLCPSYFCFSFIHCVS